MIKLWVESAQVSIFKGKYNNQVDKSSGSNQDSSGQSQTNWANTMLYRVVSM